MKINPYQSNFASTSKTNAKKQDKNNVISTVTEPDVAPNSGLLAAYNKISFKGVIL